MTERIALLLLCVLAGPVCAECATTSVTVTNEKTGVKETSTRMICWDDGDMNESWFTDGLREPGEGGYHPQHCAYFLAMKPNNCQGEKPIVGASYGQESYQMTSGLRRMLDSLANYPYTPSARANIIDALAQHTADLASLTIPTEQANTDLLQRILGSCNYQRTVSGGAEGCFSNFNSLLAEHDGTADSYRSFLLSIGVVPQPAIDWFTPSNSLRTKFDLINAQVQCNAWYAEVAANGCK